MLYERNIKNENFLFYGHKPDSDIQIQISEFDKKQDIFVLSEVEVKKILSLWHFMEIHSRIKTILSKNSSLHSDIVKNQQLLKEFTNLWLAKEKEGFPTDEIIEYLYYIKADALEPYRI